MKRNSNFLNKVWHSFKDEKLECEYVKEYLNRSKQYLKKISISLAVCYFFSFLVTLVFFFTSKTNQQYFIKMLYYFILRIIFLIINYSISLIPKLKILNGTILILSFYLDATEMSLQLNTSYITMT